ncbi:MAG: DUF4058 family protein, partial [Planctomycetales bacterium]|nr:DUF4058 family protein [Planctomycetales bacterium]
MAAESWISDRTPSCWLAARNTSGCIRPSCASRLEPARRSARRFGRYVCLTWKRWEDAPSSRARSPGEARVGPRKCARNRSRPMRCPFPGMDPYLEQPEIWPDFHDRLITF